MTRLLSGFIFLAASAMALGCGGGNETGLTEEELASEICRQQIECGYQFADQQSCSELFVEFFDEDRLVDCYTCVDAEACETEQDVCTDACSL